MLRALADENVPWRQMEIFQVDERVAPDGDADRNLTHLHESLLTRVPIAASQIHAMPVTEPDLNAAAARYAGTLAELCGEPVTIDLVHLGLGPDGHTASLVPGDRVLEVSDRDVAPTAGEYQGRRRLTLTYPVLNRARQILWLVTGESKLAMLPRLLRADSTIPAGRVSQAKATLFADQAAAGAISPGG
jgi:6-phosphogluconolactonase